MVDFIIGIIVGAILLYIFSNRKEVSGTFVIDTTDPMKDICRFEMNESLNKIYSKKHILLKVKVIEDKAR